MTKGTHGAGPPIDSKPTPGPYHWHPRVEADDRNGSVYLEKTPGHAYAVAMQPRYVENEAWAETAAFITDAFNTLHEIGLTPQQLRTAWDEARSMILGAECAEQSLAKENEQLREQRDELLAALRNFTMEVRGVWSIGPASEALMREAISNTNYNCVQRRIDEARAAIAKVEGRS